MTRPRSIGVRWLWLLCASSACAGGSEDAPRAVVVPPTLPGPAPSAAAVPAPAPVPAAEVAAEPAAPRHVPGAAVENPAAAATHAKPASKPEAADAKRVHEAATHKPEAHANDKPPRSAGAVPIKDVAAAEPPSPPPAAAQPQPEPPRPAPAPPPRGKVQVPSTEHVRVEVPSGLQAWLDADPRMQPWVSQVIKVADACYARNPSAGGTIVVRVTMHKDARPDPDIQSLPSELGGVVACATGDLMRTKMPLFTGTEGEQYTLRIRFAP